MTVPITRQEYIKRWPSFERWLKRTMPTVRVLSHNFRESDCNVWITFALPVPKAVEAYVKADAKEFVHSIGDFACQPQFEDVEQVLRSFYEDYELDSAILYKKKRTKK